MTITKIASAYVRFGSDAGGGMYSCGRDQIASQFANRMNRNSENASGTTKGAVRMPIDASTCFSTWSVTVSKKSWIPRAGAR